MALAEDSSQLKLDGIIGFSGSVQDGVHVVRSEHLPGSREWIIYPLGSLVVVRQTGTGSRAVVAFLQGHSNDVSCLCVSGDGRRLASGQDSHQGVAADVIVWDLVEACEGALAGESASEKVLLHRLRQHKGSVQAVGINSTDSLLATLGGRDDNALVIWDLESGEPICGQPAAADNALALQWLHGNPDRLITCGARHLRVWQVDVSLPKLHAMDALLGTLKRVMRCISVGSDDAFAYVGTTTGEVLKFAIDRDGIQLPNDPDRVRPMLKAVSPKRVGMGVHTCQCLTNPRTGNDNVIVGAGDGTLLLLNTDLNAIANKKEQLLGAVTSISMPNRESGQFVVCTAEANRYRVAVKDWQADLVATAHVGMPRHGERDRVLRGRAHGRHGQRLLLVAPAEDAPQSPLRADEPAAAHALWPLRAEGLPHPRPRRDASVERGRVPPLRRQLRARGLERLRRAAPRADHRRLAPGPEDGQAAAQAPRRGPEDQVQDAQDGPRRGHGGVGALASTRVIRPNEAQTRHASRYTFRGGQRLKGWGAAASFQAAASTS